VDPAVGSVFAAPEDDGSFRVVKVLAVDDAGIHLRSFVNRYPEVPAGVPDDLTLGGGLKAILDARLRGEAVSTDAPVAFGIGHYPVSRDAFARMDLRPIGTAPVTEAELAGYRTWRDAEGGVFQ
jgi:hypothetical protein